MGLKKDEHRNKQFLIEKIIHFLEFENPYMNSIEQKPEITDIVETNDKIARRVYQDLYIDVADLFQELGISLLKTYKIWMTTLKVISGILKTLWTLKIL